MTRESLHYITILEDGTIVLLYHLRGDLDQARTYLTDHKEVISCDVSKSGSRSVYIHNRPLKPIRKFFSPAQLHGIMFETPMTHTDDGFKTTMSGDEQTLHRIISEIPSDIEFTFLRKGERKPGGNMTVSLLTERQVEVPTLAVEEGYYEISRGTTHKKITTQVGAATMIAGEYLRKVEQHVFSVLIR